MQGFSRTSGWAPPQGTLGELTEAAFERASKVSHQISSLRERASSLPAPPSFREALRRDHVAIIAEVKRSSPSKGAIAPGLDAPAQAAAYMEGGAAAISVLTEPARFGGSLEDLARVSAAVSIPALRKDFIVDEVQLWEARAAGASAALVIVRALHPERLTALSNVAPDIGIELLFEVQDRDELQRALKCGAEIVGVNNRNLETLVIDPGNAPALIPEIPAKVIAMAESGMASPADALPAVRAGADALLIGSAVSAAADPVQAVRELTTFVRQPR